MPTFAVYFLPDQQSTTIDETESILQAVKAAGIPLKTSCGGGGTCGQCRVLLRKGRVKSPESGPLTGEEKEQGYILACRSYPESDLVLEIPPGSRLGEHRVVLDEGPAAAEKAADHGFAAGLLAEGPEAGPGLADLPVYKKVKLVLPEPTPADPEDDLSRLVRVIRKETGIQHLRPTLEVLRVLPRVLRQGRWEVTVALATGRGHPAVVITGIEPGHTANRDYGLALDLGTTTIAAALVDLESSGVVDVKGTYNRQSLCGDDIITRIIYAQESPEGLRELQQAALATVNDLIEELAGGQGISRTRIRAVYCAGNTVMTHLFLGLDPAQIRLEPYVPAANNIPALQAQQVGLQLDPQAWVQFIPGTASYIGGDITSGVLFTGMAFSDQLVLFLDIGTNGEMVLGGRDWLISCACSAGPAFEGGGIRHGMRAMRGAMEKLEITEGGRGVHYSTVGDVPPVGICGSGLVDGIDSLYRAGIMDRSGNFISGADLPRLRETAEGKEFVLAWSGEAGQATDITLSEVEVKNLIRSKAAVYAGIRTMLQMVGLPLEAIDRVVIAGGFGRYINIRKAISIGLLPDIPLEKYVYVGNSSLKGARLALLSGKAREALDDITGKMTYLDLSEGNTFMEEFVSALFIPHTDLTLFPNANHK